MSLQSYAVEPVHPLLAQVDPGQELAPCGLRRLVLGGGAVTAVAETVAALLSERDGETANGRRVHVVLLVDSTDIRRSGEDAKALVKA